MMLDGLRVARHCADADSARLQDDTFHHGHVDREAVSCPVDEQINWELADRMAMPEDFPCSPCVFYVRFGKAAAGAPRVVLVMGPRDVAASMYAMNVASCVGLDVPRLRPVATKSREGEALGRCLRRLARCQMEWHMPACTKALSRDYLLVSELPSGPPLAKLGPADGMDILVNTAFLGKLGALLAVDVLLNNRTRIRLDVADVADTADEQPNCSREADGVGFYDVFGSASRGRVMLCISHLEMRPLAGLRQADHYCTLVEQLCADLSSSIKKGKESMSQAIQRVVGCIFVCTGVNLGQSGGRLLEEGFASGARAIVGQEERWLSWWPVMPASEGGDIAGAAARTQGMSEESEDEDWAGGGVASRELVVVKRGLALYRASFGSQHVR